jgi:long-chain acyl-CoA synthetase
MAMSGKVENAVTLPALVAAHAKADPLGVILRRKDRGIWKTVTWAEMDQRMTAISAAVQASGLRIGDVAAILSDTNPEWAMLDLGVQAAGCVAAGLNPADGAPDIGRQLAETSARLLFVEGEAMLDKALAVRSACPDLTRIVIMDMKGLRDLAEPGCESLDLGEEGGYDGVVAGSSVGEVVQIPLDGGGVRRGGDVVGRTSEAA